MARLDLETCMDILDWFDDHTYEYVCYIMLTKIDGDARVKRALPELRKRARRLLEANRGTEHAYPEALLNLPA